MKYALFFILSLAIIQPVSAARMVPGHLPSTTPLQPMPLDTLPNYQGNVNYSSGPESAKDQPAVLDESKGGANQAEPSPAEADNQKPIAVSQNRTWLALALLLAVILAYGYWRFRKAKS